MIEQNGTVNRRRVCGDFGGRTDAGEPCGQVLGENRTRCPFHPENATPEEVQEQRVAITRKGGFAARWRTLPATIDRPEWNSRDSIVAWAEDTARQVLIGELHPALSAEARQLADLALRAHDLAALDRLDKLERLHVKGRRLA